MVATTKSLFTIIRDRLCVLQGVNLNFVYCIIIITVTYTSYRYTSVCQAIVSSVESAVDSMVSNCDE